MGFFKKIYRLYHNWHIRLHRHHYLLGALVHITSIMITAFVIVFLFTMIVMQSFTISGDSMKPTLLHNDRIFILRLGKMWATLTGADYIPKRGDIVVVSNEHQGDKWIKRVVGLPNERVVIEDGQVMIYNQEFPEGFIFDVESDPPLPAFAAKQVDIDRQIKRGEIFVLGDNRPDSEDSRGTIGNVPVENIEGTVLIRIIPIRSFRLF